MNWEYGIACVAAFGLCAIPAGAGDTEWVNYSEATAESLDVISSLGATDPEEKDYAWGDVDQDGDIDLVVVRKQPFTSSGKRRNVLLMNEDGVLTDRTTEYATASDSGGQGFLDLTNDRDVQLVDVGSAAGGPPDGWLDMVTAPTLSDGFSKTISHPRIYMNLGELAGVWQGFEYQESRIPQLAGNAPNGMPHAPRFCSVNVGDVNGDDVADLYFGDYDSGGSQTLDFNNRLLINDGNGFFTDQTASRLTFTMSNAAFGASAVIVDVNGDGVNDIVKQTSLNSPLHIAVTYNDPDNEGFFDFYETIDTQAPYFVAHGDLNRDGLVDLVIVDDNQDKYKLNIGNGADGRANFITQQLRLESGGTESVFGGNAWARADLDGDGWDDVIVTDVDVDIPGCSRTTRIYRNLGGAVPGPGEVGPNVILQEFGQVIPFSDLHGVHDVAVFDINGDDLPDLVFGKCNGTKVYLQEGPGDLTFGYPQGRPFFIEPDQPRSFKVELFANGAGSPIPGSGKIFLSIDGGPFAENPMNEINGDIYEAILPASPCGTTINYYVAAELTGGVQFTDPGNAPNTSYLAKAALGTEVTVEEQFEGNVTAWTVVNDPSLTAGAWDTADPIGTLSGTDMAAPDEDNPSAPGIIAFVTEQGLPGGEAFESDVDGGPTHLISPTLDLTGTDATIEYAQWFYTSGDDELVVSISNDNGKNWTTVATFGTTTGGQGATTEWDLFNFDVSSFVEPTDQVRVRFSVEDNPADPSVVEGAIDSFKVTELVCVEQTCPSDVNGDGVTNSQDLSAVILNWGSDDANADINGDGIVSAADLAAVILGWGDCS